MTPAAHTGEKPLHRRLEEARWDYEAAVIEYHRIAAGDPNVPFDFEGGLATFDRTAAEARER